MIDKFLFGRNGEDLKIFDEKLVRMIRNVFICDVPRNPIPEDFPCDDSKRAICFVPNNEQFSDQIKETSSSNNDISQVDKFDARRCFLLFSKISKRILFLTFESVERKTFESDFSPFFAVDETQNSFSRFIPNCEFDPQ
jgi:hypothetical protein